MIKSIPIFLTSPKHQKYIWSHLDICLSFPALLTSILYWASPLPAQPWLLLAPPPLSPPITGLSLPQCEWIGNVLQQNPVKMVVSGYSWLRKGKAGWHCRAQRRHEEQLNGALWFPNRKYRTLCLCQNLQFRRNQPRCMKIPKKNL